MFGIFKKKSLKERNDNAIEALKKRLERELFTKEQLKKLGMKSLFAKNEKFCGNLSYEDACDCLHFIRNAKAKIAAFSKHFNALADENNERLNTARADAIRNRTPLPATDAFYTIENMMHIFRSVTSEIEHDSPAPEDLKNAMSALRVALTIFFIEADVATRMINIKATSVGITIQ